VFFVTNPNDDTGTAEIMELGCGTTNHNATLKQRTTEMVENGTKHNKHSTKIVGY